MAVKWLMNTSWKELDSGAYWYGEIDRKTKSQPLHRIGILRAYRYHDNGIDMIDCVYKGKSNAMPTAKAKLILKK